MPKPAKKLSKLKSLLKRLPSFSTRLAATASTTAYNPHQKDSCQLPSGLHPVYVGKSRRQYLISSEIASHPLLQVLLQRDNGDSNGESAVVGCEVVLFEHLLWMLENGDDESVSADELVEFYAY